VKTSKTIVVAVVLLALVAGGCGADDSTSPFVHTKQALRINTGQFELTVPGHWVPQELPAKNTVYCGMTQTKDRQIIVSGFLLKKECSLEERKEAVATILAAQVKTQEEITKGEAKVTSLPLCVEGNLVVAGYIATHPSAGRVVFSRVLCDEEKAFNIYWEVLGLESAPDLEALGREFLSIARSARLN